MSATAVGARGATAELLHNLEQSQAGSSRMALCFLLRLGRVDGQAIGCLESSRFESLWEPCHLMSLATHQEKC